MANPNDGAETAPTELGLEEFAKMFESGEPEGQTPADQQDGENTPDTEVEEGQEPEATEEAEDAAVDEAGRYTVKVNGQELKVPLQELKISDKIKFNLARIMPFGEFNMIAASDYLSNIFIFKDGKLFKTYLNAHSKLITDLAWIFIYDTTLFEDSKSESNSTLP
jgi:hypothetical protein